MLDRRSDREIQHELEQAKATRLGQLATAGQEILEGLRTYARLVEFLVVIGIISIVAAFLWPTYLQAKDAVYVTTCLEKLNQLGMAMQMYHIDYGEYPPAEEWHVALSGHLGDFEEGVDPYAGEGEAAPGGDLGDFEERLNPFKCQLDHSADPTSYFYVPRSVLPWRQRRAPPTDIPMLVDELYHATKTTILWYDGHQTAVDKLDWIKMRSEKYQIRRDPQHPEWFFFVPSSAQVPGQEAQP
ncbi:MAG: hypothetical protein KAW89_04425 [Armatimonadetes bacterium]|nr:hypothetical protein [Armatimonadota bacterium]